MHADRVQEERMMMMKAAFAHADCAAYRATTTAVFVANVRGFGVLTAVSKGLHVNVIVQ